MLPERRKCTEQSIHLPRLCPVPPPTLTNPSPPCSLDTFLYPHQGLWRWFLWYGLSLRLAWAATPQYAHVDHAVRRRLTTRVYEYASCRRQVHEKKWEGGWDKCRKLKELEVRVHSLSSLVRLSLIAFAL